MEEDTVWWIEPIEVNQAQEITREVVAESSAILVIDWKNRVGGRMLLI